MATSASANGHLENQGRGEVSRNDDKNNPVSRHSASPRLSILTVGEGDLSCSLAILRAYGFYVGKLVATTLLASESELLETYPYHSTRRVLNDLKKPSNEYGDTEAIILFGVDAAQLHMNKTIVSMGPFDYILFHHPHLGYSRDRSNRTADLASRHSTLLAHYLYSARQLLVDPIPDNQYSTMEDQSERMMPIEARVPSIHVCLCAGQSKSWKLNTIVRRLDLVYSESPRFVSKPLFPHLTASSPRNTQNDKNDVVKPFNDQPVICAPQDYWLGQYGYNHQPTHPKTTQMSNAVNSHHYFFRKSTESPSNKKSMLNVIRDCQTYDTFGSNASVTDKPNNWKFAGNGHESKSFSCPICQLRFESNSALQDHLRAPALPVDASVAVEVDLQVNQRLKYRKQG